MKLIDKLKPEIISNMKDGWSLYVVAKKSRIPYRTLMKWVSTDKDLFEMNEDYKHNINLKRRGC